MAVIVSSEQHRRIEQARVDAAVVVRPIGRLDGDLVAEVRQVILEAHVPVVVDLSSSVLIDPAAVQRLATGWEMFRPRMAIVSDGLAARQLLVRAGPHDHLAVFERVDDALDALASSTQNVDGWSRPADPRSREWAVR